MNVEPMKDATPAHQPSRLCHLLRRLNDATKMGCDGFISGELG